MPQSGDQQDFRLAKDFLANGSVGRESLDFFGTDAKLGRTSSFAHYQYNTDW
jgi:hypothetical protein